MNYSAGSVGRKRWVGIRADAGESVIGDFRKMGVAVVLVIK